MTRIRIQPHTFLDDVVVKCSVGIFGHQQVVILEILRGQCRNQFAARSIRRVLIAEIHFLLAQYPLQLSTVPVLFHSDQYKMHSMLLHALSHQLCALTRYWVIPL